MEYLAIGDGPVCGLVPTLSRFPQDGLECLPSLDAIRKSRSSLASCWPDPGSGAFMNGASGP